VDDFGGDPGASLFSGGLTLRLDAFDQLVQRAGARFGWLNAFLEHTRLNGRGLLLAFIAVVGLWALPILAERVLRRLGWVRPNFRQEWLPQSFGVVVLVYALMLLGCVRYFVPYSASEIATWGWAVFGFGLLGLLDDVKGDRRYRGLRGHFRAAFQEKTLTTGFVKAVGGAGCAVWIGWLSAPWDWGRVCLSALLIALSANLVNLFDLRPGRACALFLALACPFTLWFLMTVPSVVGVPALLFVVLPAWRVWSLDAQGRVMLGDVGSNLLGACLGLAFASPSVPLGFQIGALCCLVGIHILTERVSLTEQIERRAFLRALDRLTGVRGG
jgi:UDP-N-acetylmuramyl pentapeptide phosphotransferase/UDP-N-acetylglucosamine-1-phosphate transferase